MKTKLLAVGCISSLAIPIINTPNTSWMPHHPHAYNFRHAQIAKKFDCHFEKAYNGTHSYERVVSEKMMLLQWNQYAKSWAEFVQKYPQLNFDNKSVLGVYNEHYQNANRHAYEIKKLKSIKTENIKKISFSNENDVEIEHDGGYFGAQVRLEGDIEITKDDTNIYFRYVFDINSLWSSVSNYIKVHVNSFDFS